MKVKAVYVKQGDSRTPVKFRQDNGNNRVGVILPDGVGLLKGESLVFEVSDFATGQELYDVDFVTNFREAK
jgi:hypothetical protein